MPNPSPTLNRIAFWACACCGVLWFVAAAAGDDTPAPPDPPAEKASGENAGGPKAGGEKAGGEKAGGEKAGGEKADGEEARAEKRFQDGRQALFQGRYEEAVKLLADAVAADTGKSKTTYRLNLARAHRYAGQLDKAELLLTEILKQAPDHVEAGQLLAEILHGAKRWDEVRRVLEPLLEFRHDYPTYHLLAEATFQLGAFPDARKYFREAIKLNPKSATDRYQLGNIFLAENRWAAAAAAYEESLRLGLDSPVLHYKLASAYFNLRNYFGRVTAVTVASGETGKLSGEWYLIERIPGARDQFRAAPRRSAIYQVAAALEGGMPDGPDVQMLLANTYLNARRFQRAYELYSQLGETVPEQDRALHQYYFAQSALGVGKLDEYLAHLKAAVKLDSVSYQSALVDAYLTVAEKHNQAGQLEKYIEYLTLALQENPQAASLHLKLASAYVEFRQFPQAVEQWRMVMDLEPDHPQRTDLLNLIEKYSRARP